MSHKEKHKMQSSPQMSSSDMCQLRSFRDHINSNLAQIMTTLFGTFVWEWRVSAGTSFWLWGQRDLSSDFPDL